MPCSNFPSRPHGSRPPNPCGYHERVRLAWLIASRTRWALLHSQVACPSSAVWRPSAPEILNATHAPRPHGYILYFSREPFATSARRAQAVSTMKSNGNRGPPKLRGPPESTSNHFELRTCSGVFVGATLIRPRAINSDLFGVFF